MATKNPKNPGLVFIITFFILLVINALVIFAANRFFPAYVVLGTYTITPTWALIFSSICLTLITSFALPFIRQFELTKDKMLGNREWMLVYFVINFVAVWLTARLADNLGFGIATWYVAAIMAIVLDVLQGLAMMQFEKYRTRL